MNTNFDVAHISNLRLIAVKDTKNIDKMNEYMQKLVWDSFWHGSHHGWNKFLPVD